MNRSQRILATYYLQLDFDGGFRPSWEASSNELARLTYGHWCVRSTVSLDDYTTEIVRRMSSLCIFDDEYMAEGVHKIVVNSSKPNKLG